MRSSEMTAPLKLRHILSAIERAWLATPRWSRAWVWLGVALFSLWLFFSAECSSILYYISSWDALQFEGSYPITMLALAVIPLLFKKAALVGITLENKAGFGLPRSLLLGILIIIASLQLRSLSPMGFVPCIFVVVFFLLGSLILALPDASRHAFAFFCLYIAAVSLPTFVKAFLDEQASTLYIGCSMPFLRLVGCSAQTAGQVIGFLSLSGSVLTMYVDSMCAGSGSFSVFLFLSGLTYLVTRPGKKRAVILVSAGSIALYFLNVLRLVALVYIGYASSAAVMWEAHSSLGFLFVLPFYIIYLSIFFKLVQRDNSKTPIYSVGMADEWTPMW